MRFLYLVVCLSSIAFSTPVFVFYLYSNKIKCTFNMTQSQVSLLSSVAVLSGFTSIPSGIMYDRMGPLSCAIIGLIITTAGWACFWFATISPYIFQNNTAYVLLLFAGLVGHGRTYSHTIGLAGLAKTFVPQYQPVLIALCELFYDIGIAINIAIYRSLFDEEQIETYFTFLIFLSLVINAFVAVTIPTIAPDVVGNSEEEIYRIELNYRTLDHTYDEHRWENDQTIDSSIRSYVFTAVYQLLLWSTAITIGVTTFNVFNVKFIAESLDLSQDTFSLILSNRLSGVASRIFIVLLCLLERRCFIFQATLLVSNLLLFVGQLIFNISTEMVIPYVVSGIVEGVVMSLGPILVIQLIGVENFGTNAGIMFSTISLMVVLCQMAYAWLYELNSSQGDGLACYGERCVTPSLQLMVALVALSTVLACILCAKTKKLSIPHRSS